MSVVVSVCYRFAPGPGLIVGGILLDLIECFFNARLIIEIECLIAFVCIFKKFVTILFGRVALAPGYFSFSGAL